MSDAVFRTATKSEPAKESAPKPDDTSSAVTKIDSLLYTYQDEMGHPYSAEYYEVGETYDPDLYSELETVEGYLKDLVQDGKLDNTTTAAKKQIQKLEKEAGIDKDEPKVNRMEKLAAFVKFKQEVANFDKQRAKYGRTQ